VICSPAPARPNRRNIALIPADLPLLVISGSADPVHDGERNLERMLNVYRQRLTRIDYRLYPDARHELFNETNRAAVIQELLGWLDGVLPTPGGRSVLTGGIVAVYGHGLVHPVHRVVDHPRRLGDGGTRREVNRLQDVCARGPG
jgi:hypothetical protein